MAHSYVTTFESEIQSFRSFARSFPDASTFLVDTYDTLEGTKKAAAVASEMKKQGHRLRAIRLDSGDLLDLSRKARALLDEAGLREVQIFASGGLDEFEVHELLRAAAPIDAFGVGTKVGVSADAPWTDCAYKLVEYAGRPVLKLSAGKQTLPGRKQVFRERRAGDNLSRDLIGCADEVLATESQQLLGEVMRTGKRLYPAASLQKLREHFRVQFAQLPEPCKALRAPMLYEVAISEQLRRPREQIVEETMNRELGPHKSVSAYH